MPWRGLEPPRLSAQDFESRVSTISPPRLFNSLYEILMKIKSYNISILESPIKLY